jgi:hypothetical protein
MSIMVSLVDLGEKGKWIDIRKWFAKNQSDGSCKMSPSSKGFRVKLEYAGALAMAISTMFSKWGVPREL